MKNKEITKRILKQTLGIFATAVDLVLFMSQFIIELGFSSTHNRSMVRSLGMADKLFFENKDRIVRNALYHAYEKGWLEKEGKLTREGKKRLENFLPTFLGYPKWDGEWYLTIFDIPEKMRIKRDILRENLKSLGFSQLQASVWISAKNYFGNVEEIIKQYKLEPYVILASTNKLGSEPSRILAERIWHLNEINAEYKKFFSEWKKTDKSERFWLRFKYFNILKRDPQLPKELLPKDWLGEKIHKLLSS